MADRKWYSRDRKTMVDLDRITRYDYYDQSDLAKFNDNSQDGYVPQYVNEVKMNGHFLVLIDGGLELIFRGQEALEIYNLLRSSANKRQVIL
jgi:hypothetical protein